MELTPKQSEAMESLASGDFNFIMYGGAIRGGKTVWGLSAFLILCQIYPGSRWCIIREDMEKIRTTTIPSFKKIQPSGRLRQSPYEYTHPNGSVIIFKSENYAQDKEMDWMRGLEVNGILFEEINECQQQMFWKAFERIGTWIIPNTESQPKPIILATCNPTFGWVKTLIYDRWRKDTLPTKWKYIPAKITDNPFLTEDYKESLKNLPKFEYMVFVEGNWDVMLKSGGEFFKQFDINKHIGKTTIKKQPIHLTVDNNRLPYITVSAWQISDRNVNGVDFYDIEQIAELPARDPFNTASASSQLVSNWLKEIEHSDKVYIYGDQTSTAGNTIDDEKRSFFDKFFQGIENNGFTIEKRMPTTNPSVSLSREFVDAIYEGVIPELNILIDEKCNVSIIDYCVTKEDVNGNVLKKRVRDPKTKQTYEECGHFSDAKRYFITEAFKDKYTAFSNRRSRSTFKDDQMNYFDNKKIDFKDAVADMRIVPDVNGIFSLVVSKIIEDRVYITDVIFNKDTIDSFDRTIKLINESKPEEVIFESITAWFDYGRNLRTSCDYSIRIMTEPAKKESRIQIMSGFIKNNLYFRNDYDSDPEYAAFVENLYDSYKGISIEAANILSGVGEFYKRKYTEQF